MFLDRIKVILFSNKGRRMFNDLKDSVKAKLYDYAYTPFMSSLLISWMLINHKYLLIYFTNYDLGKKLTLLKEYDFTFHTPWFNVPCAMNIWVPILFGLFYVYGYPRISKEFYEYTLKRTKDLKGIKQSIEDETPLTRAEAREIRKLASILEEEKDKALRSLSKRDEEWQLKLDNTIGDMNVKLVGLNSDVVAATVKITELETERDDLLKNKENILTQLIQSKESLNAAHSAFEQQKIEIEQLKNQGTLASFIPTKKVVKNNSNQTIKNSDGYKKVMQYLHDYFDSTSETQLLSAIGNHAQIGKTVARQILNSMIDDNILVNELGIIKMTKDGTDKVVSYVDSMNPEIPF